MSTNGATPLLEIHDIHSYYGAIIVLVMLIRPEGLIPSARRRAEFHEGVADTPLYDVQHG